MIDATADLMWLHGYRMRASGLPRPPDPRETSKASGTPSVVVEGNEYDPDTFVVEGWDDLDAVLKLIERALAGDAVPPP